MISDETLVLAAKTGDEQDLSQELWARVWQKLPSFEARSAFRTWLWTLASRLAIDHHRARIRFPVNAQDLAKELALSDSETGAAFEAVSRDHPHERYELREHIDFCLTCIFKTLELEQQMAVLLCDIHGFSNLEAAQMLGKTLPTIKHWLHDARATTPAPRRTAFSSIAAPLFPKPAFATSAANSTAFLTRSTTSKLKSQNSIWRAR